MKIVDQGWISLVQCRCVEAEFLEWGILWCNLALLPCESRSLSLGIRPEHLAKFGAMHAGSDGHVTKRFWARPDTTEYTVRMQHGVYPPIFQPVNYGVLTRTGLGKLNMHAWNAGLVWRQKPTPICMFKTDIGTNISMAVYQLTVAMDQSYT